MKYIFDRKINDDSGEYGWLIRNAPETFEPILALGATHDIFEHGRNDDGSVRDELIAFGAIFYVRGEGSYFQKKGRMNYNPGYQIHSDISMLWRDHESNQISLPSPPRTKRLDPHIEGWIDGAISAARLDLFYDAEADEQKEIEEYFAKIPGWIRIGYRRARRRFGSLSSYDLTNMFLTVEDKIRELSDDLESRLDCGEAAVLVVDACFKRKTAKIYFKE